MVKPWAARSRGEPGRECELEVNLTLAV